MNRKLLFSFLSSAFFIFIGAQDLRAQTIITTIAGNGSASFGGDGAAATAAQINHPTRAVADSSGNIFIADLLNSRIRKIDGQGLISTLVGTDTSGFNGDGLPAASTQINGPHDLALDKSGLLVFTDSENHRIRRVEGNGTVSTIVGNGTPGSGGDSGDATAAQLNDPRGIAFDSTGRLYIADYENHKIRMVDTNGKISTIAGTGSAGNGSDSGVATATALNHPRSVVVDGNGNVFLADRDNNKVRKVSGTTMTTVTGNGTGAFSGDNGPASAAQVFGPSGVAVDASGNLLIADSGNNRIRKVDASQNITTIVGNGTSGFSGDGAAPMDAQLNGPAGVAADSKGNLYIAESGNNRIRLVGVPANFPQTGNTTTGGATTPQTGASSSCQLNPSDSPLSFAALVMGPVLSLTILFVRRIFFSPKNSVILRKRIEA